MSQLIVNGSINASSIPLIESPVKQCKEHALSVVEAAILRSSFPIDIKESEQITVLGQSGIWANKCEVASWNGPIPINQYSLNEDADPEVIFKKVNQNLEYIQELAVRYLKPSTPPPPGDIIITQEPNVLVPPAPPVIIRQQPPRPCTPKPLVIRESPPKQPPVLGRKLITISGKQLPPPPRKVVIERLPPLPSKPQPLIVERWLPYRPTCKRRVIFQTAPPDPVIIKPRNVLVQWTPPEVSIRQEIKYLGVVKANPIEYTERYGDTLKSADQLPGIVTQIQNPEGIILAADQPTCKVLPELEGEIEALKLIDLEAEGLGEYKSIVYKMTSDEKSNCSFVPILTPINSKSSDTSNSTDLTETNNTTIIVNSSPIASGLDTSKLATPVSEIETKSTLNETFSPCTNPDPNLSKLVEPDSASVLIPPASTSVSAEPLMQSIQSIEESVDSANLINSQMFSESTLTLTTDQPKVPNEQLNSDGVIESSLIGNPEKTSLFSNITTSIQAPLTIDSINNNNQSTDFTLVTPSIQPVIPGTPVSSMLSSRLSLKSTSIALISASASATSVSTLPTTTLNTLNASCDSMPKQVELTPKTATPTSLFKTPVPVTATPSKSESRSCRSVADSVIERLFTLIDINGDGAVSIEEAERIFMKLNTRLGRNYGSEDVKNFFQSLDPAGTGKINMEQFKKAFPNRV